MKICLVTPAPPRSRKGNRVTALRWARILRELGHRVKVQQEYHTGRFDVLIALHALRSFRSIERFQKSRPSGAIVVALTGTDLYQSIHSSRRARKSLEWATRLVLLQAHGLAQLPTKLQKKSHVILQSAKPPLGIMAPLKNVFEVCVVGHLRTVKDPFRAALACRRLPESSRIRVTHLGAALNSAMLQRALREAELNPRYRWLGEQPHWRTQRLLARSRLLVISSKMEGAPNVASEAIAAQVPVLATRVSGNIGLLGDAYPGYFTVGDTAGLRQLISRCEIDARFHGRLNRAIGRLRPLVEQPRERSAWQDLLAEIVP